MFNTAPSGFGGEAAAAWARWSSWLEISTWLQLGRSPLAGDPVQHRGLRPGSRLVTAARPACGPRASTRQRSGIRHGRAHAAPGGRRHRAGHRGARLKPSPAITWCRTSRWISTRCRWLGQAPEPPPVVTDRQGTMKIATAVQTMMKDTGGGVARRVVENERWRRRQTSDGRDASAGCASGSWIGGLRRRHFGGD